MKNVPSKKLRLRLLNVVTMACLFIMPIRSEAQHNTVFTSLLKTVKIDTTARILTFSANTTEHEVYLKWTVIQQAQNGIYFIERSINGERYKVVGTKAGVGSSIKKPLLYCYADTLLKGSEIKYRIVHVTENDISFLKSDEILIKRGMENMVNAGTLPSRVKQSLL